MCHVVIEQQVGLTAWLVIPPKQRDDNLAQQQHNSETTMKSIKDTNRDACGSPSVHA